MPKYLTIADYIEAQILNQTWLPNQQLPSEKEMMQQFQVSRQTIRNALEYLSKKDLVYSEQGRGTFVSDSRRSSANPGNKNVALILGKLDSYIFPYKSVGINAVLTRNGYTSSVFASNIRIDHQDQLIRNVLSGSYAGVIMEVAKAALPRHNPELLEELRSRMPVVLIDGYYRETDIPYVAIDDFNGGYMAAEHLIAKGHRRIFHVGMLDAIQGMLRYQGYARALTDHGIPLNDDLIYWCVEEDQNFMSEARLTEICQKILSCTAVFFYNDLMTMRILPTLLKMGVKIPDQLAVMGYDDSNQYIHGVPISSICYPKERLGEKAAENLLHLIRNPEFDANYLFQPVLIERESTNLILKE
ncbi:MAG: GntR family transcriptional regulator [Eubacterium sp.]|nr:GntR family transcriptional regulator [Eubacterium sp.]